MFVEKKRNKLYQFFIDVLRTVFFTYYNLRIKFKKPYKYILIIAMKRSGSSLLAHILSSNEEINGHGEAWIQYNSKKDFNSLVRITHWTRRMLRMPTEFVLDKIVHDRLIPDKKLLNTENVYKIFLVREPKGTIPSLIAEELKYLYEYDINNAVDEYVKRLDGFANYIDIIEDKSKCLFVTYDELIQNTDKTLKKLQNFLSLEKPLTENYKLNRTSGKPIFGDTSENITQGKILRKTMNKKEEFIFPKELLEKANNAFFRCKKNFSTIDNILEHE